MYIRSLV